MDTKINTNSMKDLVESYGPALVPIKEGSTVEAVVVSKTRNRIVVNVNDFCMGIIPEKEFSTEIYDLVPGEKILAYLLDIENDDGFAVLSLRRADKERVWQNLKQKMDSGETVKVKVLDANRGGLIVQFGSIEGFLPISQLYQKYSVSKNDPSQIIEKLRKMVDKVLEVKIISLDKSSNKLIFSEKEVGKSNQMEQVKKLYKIGDKVKGEVSAIVPFGLFVDLGDIEGLVHISEISWDRVNDINKLYRTGDKIDVEVINIEDGKISLSIKRLSTDPWLKAVESYKKDQVIEGKITKITPFGAFVELDKDITGLVHISELLSKAKNNKIAKVEDVLEVGKKYKFKIIEIKSDSHRVSLALQEEEAKPKASKTSKKK